ncbi:hypothetical protein GCM10022221_31430 [Actinocorallia aurea]
MATPAAPPPRLPVIAPVAVWAASAAIQTAASLAGAASAVETAVGAAVAFLPLALGVLVALRAPRTPVGPALCWVGAAPVAVTALENWDAAASGPAHWPLPAPLHTAALGSWIWHLAGFVALCLVFPDGLPPGRRWQLLARAAPCVAVAETVLVGVLRGHEGRLEGPASLLLSAAVFGPLLLVVGAAALCPALRHRRAGPRERAQLRWLVLGAGSVPVLLVGGWYAEELGAPPVAAYTWFLLAILVAVPAAVAVAVLRHDLFDIDRLLSGSLAWLATTAVSAALFTAVVLAAGRLLGSDGPGGAAGGAFATALLLLPLHRRIDARVGRIVDRDRYVTRAEIGRFTAAVRDGAAEPEQVRDVLARTLDDPDLRLLVALPGGRVRDPAEPAGDHPAPHGPGVLPLRGGGTDVGWIVCGDTGARALRRAADAARWARLPIEVARLRLESREALEDARASRARIVEAAAQERRVLERDLHDGAQQQIVAVGMRLRSLQRRLPDSVHGDVDEIVAALEATIAELRRLAHGIRPVRLDDGLPAALHGLLADAPLPVTLRVADPPVSEVLATTVYFAVAESYANVLKHARADSVAISVAMDADGALRVEVRDDGAGGAGTGPVSVRDRVASVGGTMEVDSPPGGGTTVKVVIPDAAGRGR